MLVPASSVKSSAAMPRFDQLRELIPHRDKLDKASFLLQTVDYIRQLQVGPRHRSSAKSLSYDSGVFGSCAVVLHGPAERRHHALCPASWQAPMCGRSCQSPSPAETRAFLRRTCCISCCVWAHWWTCPTTCSGRRACCCPRAQPARRPPSPGTHRVGPPCPRRHRPRGQVSLPPRPQCSTRCPSRPWRKSQRARQPGLRTLQHPSCNRCPCLLVRQHLVARSSMRW